MKKLIIKDFLNSELAVTSDKAESVYEFLVESIQRKEPIEISFDGINVLTTAFLNTAIGKLYDVASRDELNNYVKISTESLNNSHFNKIKMVMNNSREKREEKQKLTERVMQYGE